MLRCEYEFLLGLRIWVVGCGLGWVGGGGVLDVDADVEAAAVEGWVGVRGRRVEKLRRATIGRHRTASLTSTVSQLSPDSSEIELPARILFISS